MKSFLIRYRFKDGSEADWQKEIAAFIAALDTDPAVKGRIAYRVMKSQKSADYFHLATPLDEQAAAVLGQQDFFKRYTERNRLVSGGEVEVTPLELVAEAKARA